MHKYGAVLSESRIKNVINKQIEIVDSSTISLFKDILSCVGHKYKEGKSKGVKVHIVINADEIVPNLIWFSPATTHDHNFLKKLKCDNNTVYVFDKGYNDYMAFKHFTDHKTGIVTRIKDYALYEEVEILKITQGIHSGALSYKIIEVEIKEGKEKTELKLRKVTFYDRENKR